MTERRNRGCLLCASIADRPELTAEVILVKFHSTIPPELSTSVFAQEVRHPDEDGMAVVKKTTLVGPT